MSEIAGVRARGKSGAVAHTVRTARTCAAEARPVVQIVFVMRFMTGLLFQLPGTLSPFRAALGALGWRGDALAGRRTLAVVRGERAARVLSAAGAVWVALRCRRPHAARGPYRAFMVTQYATHAAMLTALAVRSAETAA